MADFDENTPPQLVFNDQVFAIAFSPTANIVASGLISGPVFVNRYAQEGNQQLFHLSHHQKACRALEFSHDGSALFTASKDKSLSLVNMATGQVVSTVENAHADPINSLCLLDETLLASGDDEGCVKVWDLRSQQMVMEVEECEDFISDMVFRADKKILLTTSGDGTLCAFNMRKRELIKRSDFMDEELLSLAIMKGGNKVVCGTQEGVLDIFSWGQWGDLSDRFVGHPLSVDSVVALNDELLCTGSSDGLIRVVQIHPNKLLGVVGEHQDFPIERIRLSHDKHYLGSCSHDKTVKFWDVSSLVSEKADGEDDEMEDVDSDEEQGMQVDARAEGKKDWNKKEDNFFADL
eukprot:comp50296_c0_seq1/m.47636 comp50296_c0_seq1/g.47636  ORF comp50296_c0_seq1/g.47636 comp50296_c0_seq1/m.47636 type:complete len:349 (-) comp50296_c0_seq1:241-1287(-)